MLVKYFKSYFWLDESDPCLDLTQVANDKLPAHLMDELVLTELRLAL